ESQRYLQAGPRCQMMYLQATASGVHPALQTIEPMVFLALCASDTHAVVVDTKHGLGVDVVKTDGTGTGLGVADNVGDRLTNHPCKNLLLHQCQVRQPLRAVEV